MRCGTIFWQTGCIVGITNNNIYHIHCKGKYLLDKWQPNYIEGLPRGDNEIKLTLVDNAGNIVPTPLNLVSRKFKQEGDPEMN